MFRILIFNFSANLFALLLFLSNYCSLFFRLSNIIDFYLPLALLLKSIEPEFLLFSFISIKVFLTYFILYSSEYFPRYPNFKQQSHQITIPGSFLGSIVESTINTLTNNIDKLIIAKMVTLAIPKRNY